ncbi:unnamed protein product [Rotaria sp. Silwood2]|nr:unnamed protein product [Rotaria sp. Silwood2]CAF2721180.1 unnamed protein product [Rotaria sp. Silwood2]CAF3143241.1 unnamed protein product [Rotaria sp. Silwood2]CAF4280954.1 unnamed protein product [Rotaria sp. Silwood2]CAF4284300.1 unnamed protein product [Rotaria sp. Silwood2]
MSQKASNSHCFKWASANHQVPTIYECSNYAHISSFVWTYSGTGIMKYIQWILIRKLGNIKITRLNNNCHIIEENYFSSKSTNDMFIQVYIMSLSTNLAYKSQCSEKFNQIAKVSSGRINRIYFKRKSIKATLVFQQLDLMKSNFNITLSFNNSFKKLMKKAIYTVKRFSSYFTSVGSIKWIVIHSEDLIKTNLVDCEKVLTDFISLLGLNISSLKIKNIIQYDSHQFIEDSTWWDQSNVGESILDISIPYRSKNFTYSNDFYYLHGDRSFIQYLSDSRQC